MIEIKRVQDGKVVMRFETETLAGGRFVNTDFSGTDLSGMEFSGADLRNCNLNELSFVVGPRLMIHSRIAFEPRQKRALSVLDRKSRAKWKTYTLIDK